MKTKTLLTMALLLSAVAVFGLVQSASAQKATVTIAGPDAAAPGKEVSFALKVAGEDGKPIAGSVAAVKITKGDKAVKEDKVAADTGEAAYKATFADAGSYVVSVTFSPGEKATVKYAPASAQKKVEVK